MPNLKKRKIRNIKLIGLRLRYNNLLGTIIEGFIEGKNKRKTPPLEYIRLVLNGIGYESNNALKRKAENSIEWKNAANQPLGEIKH